MIPTLAFRFILTIGIIFLGWVIFHFLQLANLNRIEHNPNSLPIPKPGVTTIVYFTTPDCVVCKTTQRPALASLQEKMMDRLQIIEVNAYEKPDMAKAWGVMSVPTTFILDSQGKPRHVNYGVTPMEKLYGQI